VKPARSRQWAASAAPVAEIGAPDRQRLAAPGSPTATRVAAPAAARRRRAETVVLAASTLSMRGPLVGCAM
jgi:hypothetical protein